LSESLNKRALHRFDYAADRTEELGISVSTVTGGGRLFDFGIEQPGGLQAGLELARFCLSDLGDVCVSPGSLAGLRWPVVQTTTDHPVHACLFSQYAGWQIKTDDFFAMGSGPMRAVAAREPLFETLDFRETADQIVGVLETGQTPDSSVYEYLAERSGVPAENIHLAGASVCSIAGVVQVVARSVETALHKLFELGFNVHRVRSGFGTAPLPPVARDELTGIGRTNDAILYGGTVTLWVTGDDASVEEIGPQVPSGSSESFGKPFLELFEAAGGDFYALDPQLFSPAVVMLHNIETGSLFRFGRTNEDVLRHSFGL